MRDESVSRVDETNSVATSLITTRLSGELTRRIDPMHDEMIWEVDETNSVHNETNRNNDSTTRNANLVSDLTS